MALQLDHLILAVNDRAQSIEFYTRVLGLTYEGEREPFSMLRVTPDLVLQLAPRKSDNPSGGMAAFSSRAREKREVRRSAPAVDAQWLDRGRYAAAWHIGCSAEGERRNR